MLNIMMAFNGETPIMAVVLPQLCNRKHKVVYLLHLCETKTALAANTMTNVFPVRQPLCCTNSGSSRSPGDDLLTRPKQRLLKEAGHSVLHGMDHRGIWPDKFRYASLLQACLDNGAPPRIKLVHAHIIQTGFQPDVFLENKLIITYTKCSSLVDARRVFEQTPERNVVSWTAMIAAYGKDGHTEVAFRLFHQMHQVGIQPNQFTFGTILPFCADLTALEHGKQIHQHIIKSGFQSDMHVGSALVHMYVKCRSLIDARKVFDKIPERDAILWNAMIAGYAQSENVDEALKLFEEMPERNVVSWNAMIAGFAQSGHVDDAKELFQQTPEINVVTWNSMIAAYSRLGHNEEAVSLFYQMRQTGARPDQFTFAGVLTACANLASLELGRDIHKDIVRSGCQPDVFVASALVDMYGKCGRIEDAHQVFENMLERNTVSWNSMIAGYVQNGQVDQAVKLFYKMPERDVVSWNSIIAGYAQDGQVEEALKLFQQMPEQDVVSWNAIIAGYIQSGRLDEALKLFNEMPERDVVSWNALIAGYAKNGQLDRALELFEIMPEQNVVTWNSMIAGYAQNGDVDEAKNLFQKMPERNKGSCNSLITAYAQNWHIDEAINLFQKVPKQTMVSGNAMIAGFALNGHDDEAQKSFEKIPERDIISWNAMIAGYVQNGYFDEALNLFREMQHTYAKLESGTFATILPACANLAALEHGKVIHKEIIRSGYRTHVAVGNSLIDMYTKSGNIEDGRKVFDKMPQQDVVSWTTMIIGYGMHGYGKDALQLLEQMQLSGQKPNYVTFLGVLSACCHAGLVDDGLQLFDRMSQDYHISPTLEHYCCIVDLLGRAGLLDEAQTFINKMPIKPDAAVWGSLLAACRIHKNIDLGEHVAKCLLELDPENPAPYVLLSNIYATAGRWAGVHKMRKMMKDRNVKKMPGQSWIEVNNKVHIFIVGD